MKYKLIIDETLEESIVITAHCKNEKIIKIEKIIQDNKQNKIVGYRLDEKALIDIENVLAFYTKNKKVFIITQNAEYLIKERLYQIEEIIDDNFIKINQGCLINISKILKFDSSIIGTLKVILINGFEDYISRRELKNVKRRIGLWNISKILWLED